MNWNRTTTVVFGVGLTAATYLIDIGPASAMSSTARDGIRQETVVAQVLTHGQLTAICST